MTSFRHIRQNGHLGGLKSTGAGIQAQRRSMLSNQRGTFPIETMSVRQERRRRAHWCLAIGPISSTIYGTVLTHAIPTEQACHAHR
jgi:hypothetical protein